MKKTPRLMHTPVYFGDVRSFAEVAPDGSNLFPNVRIAEGRTEAERSLFAAQLLLSEPEIDTVVFLPDLSQSIVAPLDALDRLSYGRRIKVDIEQSNVNQNGEIAIGLKMYFEGRMRSLFQGAATPYDIADVELVSDMMQNINTERNVIDGTSISKTSMTYMPTYGGPGQKFINAHIDRFEGHDLRRVDCQEGSGTVIFNRQQFDIQPYADETMEVMFHAIKKTPQIDCLAVPTGGSLMMRGTSPRLIGMGLLPTFHAHGIGRPGESERRLTERHDYSLTPEIV